MGGVSSEKGVLKLVYPGGSVEVHKEAITAAEVMKRNPRHCVTRPDVFKYPWIVVRPESILLPGRVFFVVPYHTIRRLLQSTGIMATEKQPPKHGLKETDDMWAGEVAIKVDKSLSNPRQDKIFYEQHEQYGCQPLIEPTKIQSRRRKTVNSYHYEEDYERRRVDSFDDPFGSNCVIKVPKEKVVGEQKKRTRKVCKEEPKKQYPVENWPLKIPSTKTYPITFVEDRVSYFTKQNSNFLQNNSEVTNLKSCLKKPGISVPKGLKVTFVIPSDDDD